MPENRRELLELLAYGRDPDLRPGDRLRALQLLDELDDEDGVGALLARDIARMTPEEMAEITDAAQAVVVADLIRGDEETAATYPATAAVIAQALDQRAREMARELSAPWPTADDPSEPRCADSASEPAALSDLQTTVTVTET